jgi:hypothetical protein
MSRDSELGGAHVAGDGDQLCALGYDPLLGIVSSAVHCALGQSKFNQIVARISAASRPTVAIPNEASHNLIVLLGRRRTAEIGLLINRQAVMCGRIGRV